ncbi:MAG: transporter [Gemmatimonadales bacterium]
MLRRGVPSLVLLALGASPLAAQGLRQKIASELFTYGTCGLPLCLQGSLVGHENHFIPAQATGTASIISFLTSAVGVSVANVPVSAASSGATFRFEGGLPVKTSGSAGPVFGERSQTLGRGRFFLGTNVSVMNFDRLRGIPLDHLSLNFAHQNTGGPNFGDPVFENEVVQVNVALDVSLVVTSFFASVGLVDGVDLGVSVPVVHTSITGRSVAQVIPFGAGTPHRFATDTAGNPVLTAVAGTEGSATGVGDVSARLKINIAQSQSFGVAVLADARFSTGDEENLLGAGAFAGRGMAIVSARFGDFAPHGNLGYVFRDSELQNDAIVATIGFDQLLGPWATMAFDLLTEWQVGTSQLELPGPIVFDVPYVRSVAATNLPSRRDDLMSASLGFKFTTPRGIHLVINALFPLRDAGLQPNAVWTGGLEYNF